MDKTSLDSILQHEQTTLKRSFERGIPYIEDASGRRVYVFTDAPVDVVGLGLSEGAFFHQARYRQEVYASPDAPPRRFLDALLFDLLLRGEMRAVREEHKDLVMERLFFLGDASAYQLRVYFSNPDGLVYCVVDDATGSRERHIDYDLAYARRALPPLRYAFLWQAAHWHYSLAAFSLPYSRALGDWQKILTQYMARSELRDGEVFYTLSGNCEAMFGEQCASRREVVGTAHLTKYADPTKPMIYKATVVIKSLDANKRALVPTERPYIFVETPATETGVLLAMLYYARKLCHRPVS